MKRIDSAPASAPARPADLVSHADALYRLAWHLCASSADAEDLVQETFVRAIRALDHFTPGTNLHAWLARILRNAWLDRARAAGRRQVRDAEVEDTPEDGLAAPRASLRGDADLERMRGLVGEEIEAALMTLTPDARTVVLLDLDGLTEGEIAQVVGCAVGTVKSRLARARRVLRERLADYGR